MNRLIRYAGVMFSFFITANFYVIIVVSMFSSNDIVIVYFNHFGEAVIEYIIYTAIAPIVMYAFYCEIIKFRRNKKDAKKRHTEVRAEDIDRV